MPDNESRLQATEESLEHHQTPHPTPENDFAFLLLYFALYGSRGTKCTAGVAAADTFQ